MTNHKHVPNFSLTSSFRRKIINCHFSLLMRAHIEQFHEERSLQTGLKKCCKIGLLLHTPNDELLPWLSRAGMKVQEPGTAEQGCHPILISALGTQLIFFPGTQVFLSPEKQTFPNSSLTWPTFPNSSSTWQRTRMKSSQDHCLFRYRQCNSLCFCYFFLF